MSHEHEDEQGQQESYQQPQMESAAQIHDWTSLAQEYGLKLDEIDRVLQDRSDEEEIA